MSQEISPAKRKFDEAFRSERELVIFGQVNRSQLKERGETIIRLYEEALSLGLTRMDEIECHARLGNLFFVKGQFDEGLNRAIEKGLYGTPFYQRYVTEMEKALKLDAQRGGEFFKYAADRDVFFAPLALLWRANSKFIKKRDEFGHLSAISYLHAKVKLLDYLGGSYFPILFFELGSLHGELAKTAAYDDLGHGEKAIEWFTRAADAELATDTSSEFDIKKRAREEIKTLLRIGEMRT